VAAGRGITIDVRQGDVLDTHADILLLK